MSKHTKSFLFALLVLAAIVLVVWLIVHMARMQRQSSMLSQMALELEQRQSELIAQKSRLSDVNEYNNSVEGKKLIAKLLGYQESGEEAIIFQPQDQNYDKIEQEYSAVRTPIQDWFEVFFK